MKSFLAYLLVAAASGGLAWFVFGGSGGESTDGKAEPISQLDDPLFYLDISAEERLERARLRLDVMANTSIAATSTGSVKDELALLCHDEAVVDLIVDDFERRRKSDAPLSSFMELFARKKHAKFAPLVLYGLQSTNFESKSNAKRAVAVQRHPNVVQPLIKLLDESEDGGNPSVVEALIAVGNHEALEALRSRLSTMNRECLLSAMPALAQRQLKESIPQFRELGRHKNADVRVLSAWALASLGLSEGARRLRGFVADETMSDPSRAQALQYLYRAVGSEAIEVYDRWARSDLRNLGFEALVCLLKCGHEEGYSRVMRDLKGDDLVRRFQALTVLGRIGDLDALKMVQDDWKKYQADELAGLVGGLSLAGVKEVLPMLRDLFLAGNPYRLVAERYFESYGTSAIPFLAELMERIDKPDERQRLIAIIASIHHPESRALLQKMHPGKTRAEIIFHRTALRQIDLSMAKQS